MKTSLLRVFGQELRDDWNDFDGRDAKEKLNELADEIEQEVREAIKKAETLLGPINPTTMVIRKELGL